MNRFRQAGCSLAWVVAAILPWPALRLQETVRYGAHPADLWPWATVFTVLQSLALVALLFCVRGQSPQPGTSPARPLARWERILVLVSGLGLVVLIASRIRIYLVRLWHDPIDPTLGDQLPLILMTLRDTWRDGIFPYHVYTPGSWSMSLNYWPGLWLPFSIPYALGLDLRVWCAAGVGSVAIVMAAWGLFSWSRWRSPAALIPILASLALLLLHHQFFVISHVGGHWMFLVLWALLLLADMPWGAAVCLGICAAGRQYCVFLLPLWAIYAWPHPARRKHLLACLATMMFIILPYLLPDPRAFIVSAFSSFEDQLLAHVREDPLNAHGLGYSGLFLRLGIFSARLPTAGALVLTLYWLAARRGLQTTRDLLLYSAVAITVFLYFSVIPYYYTYFDGLLLLAVVAAAPAHEDPLLPAGFRRFLIAAPVVVFIACIAFFELAFPNRLPPREAAKGVHLRGSMKLLQGFAMNGAALNRRKWLPADGGAPARIRSTNAYVAIPVEDTRAVTFETSWSADDFPGDFDAHLYLNGEHIGDLPLEPGRSIWQFPVPRGNLFRGSNLLRIHITSDGDDAPLDILAARFIKLRSARFEVGGQSLGWPQHSP